MATFFIDRQYPHEVVHGSLQKVEKLSREKTMQTKPQADSDRPIVTMIYHPHTNPVRRILLSNWTFLSSTKEAADIFSQPPLVAYKRDVNLRDMLVRSTLKSCHTTRPSGSTPCNVHNCKTCPFVCPSTVVIGPRYKFNIDRYFTCQTTNVIYVISCQKCGQLYIGETERTINDRFKEHLQSIKYRYNRPVGRHFNQADHSISDIRVKGLWLMQASNIWDRKDREKFLITKLGTVTPLGMNMKD